MPQFSSKRRVRHSAADMFDLVADVEKYPRFVPLCSALRVKSNEARSNEVSVLVADMTVAYKLIRQTFSSRVTLDKPNRKILVEYLDGPFSHMQNRWIFRPAGEGANPQACDVDFSLDYEFKSRTMALLMGAMFDAAFRRFAAAFEKRADEIYRNKAE
jgi:coenzyme Q-binding protein COQ10